MMTKRIIKIFPLFFGRDREDENRATMGRSTAYNWRVELNKVFERQTLRAKYLNK